MKYYWLISNCFSFFCFRLSLFRIYSIFVFFLYLACVVVLLRLCFLLSALNSSHNIYLLVFCFFLTELLDFSLCFSMFSI